MQKTVVLQPDESTEVSLQFTPPEARTYQVSIDGLSGSFVAIPLPPPPVCTIGETKCVGYDLYECQRVDPLTQDWVLTEINSLACGYVPPPPPVCVIGKTRCEGFDLYECQLVDPLTPDWVLVKTNSEDCGYVPPAECTGREQKCVGYDLYICLGGRWNLFTKNSTICGYVPPPVCTEGEFKCVGLDRHRCQNNQWVLYEQNSTDCGYEPPTPPPLDYLLMSKSELYNSLINGNVAADWWNMDYSNRRELGLRIVQWWSYDYFDYQALALAYGGPNSTNPPTFDPYEEPEKTIKGSMGLGMEQAHAYRHVLFSNISPTKVPNNVYWWKQHSGASINSDEPEPRVWKCYEPGVRFKLPMALALGAADWLNCLQIAKDVSKLESWIFFQTWLIDGYPGCDGHHWPLEKYGREATIWTIDSIRSVGITQPGEKIATISW